MNYLIWKNQDSRTLKGLLISELPPITKPRMRVLETEIDGVDGSIIEELGYETYDKEILIGLSKDFDINEIIKYFSGYGEVIFSNEPDKYYKAKIIEQIDFERLLRFKTATVIFRVQPFKYSQSEGSETRVFNSKNLLDFSKYYSNKNKLSVSSGSIEVTQNSLIFTNPAGYDQILMGNFSASTSPTEADIEIVNTFGLAVEPNTEYSLVVNSTNNAEIWVICYDSNYVYKTRKTIFIDGSGEHINKFTTPEDCNYIGFRITNQSYRISDGELTLSELKIIKGDYVPTKFKIINNGNTTAKPVITLKGIETINFHLNNSAVFDYTFDNDGEVIIDTEKQDAYLGTLLKNRNMIGEFPILQIGENTIQIDGTISYMKIEKKSRWL